MGSKGFRTHDPGAGKSIRVNDPVGSLPQEELDRLFIEVRDRYLAKDARSARIAFACELQGFVAAEVERGGDFADAMRRVGDLVGLLIKAQEQGG